MDNQEIWIILLKHTLIMKEMIRKEDFKTNYEVSKFWAQMILKNYEPYNIKNQLIIY